MEREYAVENLMFWKSVEEFRQLKDPGLRTEKAHQIYKSFLEEGASMEINIPAKLADRVKEKIKKTEIDGAVFDQLQHHVFEMLRADAYLRFKQNK